MNEEMTYLVQVGIRCNADDTTGHDLTDSLPLFADDIILGDDSNNHLLFIHNREATNTMLREQAGCLLCGLLRGNRYHIGSHDIYNFHDAIPFLDVSHGERQEECNLHSCKHEKYKSMQDSKRIFNIEATRITIFLSYTTKFQIFWLHSGKHFNHLEISFKRGVKVVLIPPFEG